MPRQGLGEFFGVTFPKNGGTIGSLTHPLVRRPGRRRTKREDAAGEERRRGGGRSTLDQDPEGESGQLSLQLGDGGGSSWELQELRRRRQNGVRRLVAAA